MRRFSLLLPLLLVSNAQACLNDRDSDSLALQAAQFPDTLRVITGRFERNPPLFYEMRIQKSLAQLKKSPRNFGLYDDIGVAFDKLHRDDEALAIMAKKRALLPPFDAKNKTLKEAWYRYFANAGTFHAHRFMSAKTADLSEMKLARGMIKRAIEIKPNAHFGREKYQLMAMDWILASKTGKTKKSLGDFLTVRDDWGNGEPVKEKAATEGLSGLIVLGAAWQSVDIFDALGTSLETKNGITLFYLAQLRTQELLQQGRKSLSPKEVNLKNVGLELLSSTAFDEETTISVQNQKTLNQLYPQLRAEAEDWSAKRQSYMLARMKKGDHPDTNSQFWSDWKPDPAPSLDVAWFNRGTGRYETSDRSPVIMGLAILGGTLIASILALRFLARRRNAI